MDDVTQKKKAGFDRSFREIDAFQLLNDFVCSRWSIGYECRSCNFTAAAVFFAVQNAAGELS